MTLLKALKFVAWMSISLFVVCFASHLLIGLWNLYVVSALHTSPITFHTGIHFAFIFAGVLIGVIGLIDTLGAFDWEKNHESPH